MLFLLTCAVFLTSCEKRCVCKHIDDGSEDIVYSAYSKKECTDWDKYLNENLGEKVDCTYKRVN